MNTLLAIIIGCSLVLVLVFAYILFRLEVNRRRSLSMVFLHIRIPKKDSKEDKETDSEGMSANKDFKEQLSIMKQMYESIYAIVDGKWTHWFFGQPFLSLEYVVKNNRLEFYAVCPDSLKSIIEKQITGFYPDCYIEEEPDYNLFQENSKVAHCYMNSSSEYWMPIRTYQQMDLDPLNNICNAVSKLGPQESAAIQVMIRPVLNGWQKKGRAKAKDILDDKQSSFLGNLNPLSWIGDMLSILFRGEAGGNEGPDGGGRTSPMVDEQVKMMEAKNTSFGFESIIRLIAVSDTSSKANGILANMQTSFAPYSSTETNSLDDYGRFNMDIVNNFLMRNMWKPFWIPKMILSPEELASVFHLPNIRYNKAPNINWQNYKIAPPPDNLPKEGILLGHNVYRGVKSEIRMKNEDRFRHFYVVGQTGTGKSSVLQVMIRQDLKQGKGVCVMDPHGQLIDDLLPFVPRERADDVIFFNPADLERPMGLNLLEAHDPAERDAIALEAMNIMIKLFGDEIFGPRIQDYFRNGCLTLMEDPEGGALTDIVRLFTDDDFQKEKTKNVQNPVVRSFWEHQMAKTGAREKQEMIPYFASKFGGFVTNGLMRNIIGQTKSAFNFAEVMDQGKILFVNLSKGETGDINSKLLGMIIVAKLQQAALARQKQAKEDRRDFFMYIDEFQNYVTDSIEVILSEARKYRLSLNMAHQYLAQLEDSGGGKKGSSGVNLKDAVFGNVGSVMCYKIGAQDAEYMAKEMAPVFADQDLVNIDKYKAVMKLSIDTQPSRPFSIIPVNPYLETGDHEAAEAFKQLSRLKYGRDKEFVEREIFRRMGTVF